MFQQNIKTYFTEQFYFMDSSKYTGTVEEAGLEIESEFEFKANLVDFSTEFKKRFDCLQIDEENDTDAAIKNRKTRILTFGENR